MSFSGVTGTSEKRPCARASATLVAVATILVTACGGTDSASPNLTRAGTTASDAVQREDQGAIDLGAEVYAANCQACHGDQDGRGRTAGAPPHNQDGHTWHHPDAQLKGWILNGKVGLGQMPPFKDQLTEEEVDVVLAYIKTWWTPGQRESQADISRRYQGALDKQEKGQ